MVLLLLLMMMWWIVVTVIADSMSMAEIFRSLGNAFQSTSQHVCSRCP